MNNFIYTPSTLLILILLSFSAQAFDSTQTQNALQLAVTALEATQHKTHGGWGSQPLRAITTAASVSALRSAKSYSASYYAGLAWLENHQANNVDALSRKIRSLAYHSNTMALELASLEAQQSNHTTGWGISHAYQASPLDSAHAIRALRATGSTANLDNSIDTILALQLLDGGWSTTNTNTSHYGITADVVLALAELVPTVTIDLALAKATTYLATAPLTLDSFLLSRVLLALYKQQGLSTTLDALIAELLSRQNPDGDWNDELTTASAARALAALLELDTHNDDNPAAIKDPTLRAAINIQLGKGALDQLLLSELLQLAHLDLGAYGPLDLTGLGYAGYLQTLIVAEGTNLSPINGLSDLTVIVSNTTAKTIKQQDAIKGDINGDGIVDIADVLLLQHYLMGHVDLDEASLARGKLYSATPSGELTLADLLLLQQKVQDT